MSDKIKAALAQLDPLNDDHWTTDGAPRMDAIESILGDTTVTRKDVINAAPDFNREKAGEPVEEPSGEKEEPIKEPPPPPNGDTASGEPPHVLNINPQGGSYTREQIEEFLAKLNATLGDQTLEIVTKGQDVEVDLPLNVEMIDLRSLASELLATKDVDLLEAQEESLQGLMEATVHTRDEMVASIVNLRGAISLIRQRIQQVRPAITNQQAIGDYIRAQSQSRAEKVARRREILRGLDVATLDPRAPIDAAMARKTRRGTKRPERPMMR